MYLLNKYFIRVFVMITLVICLIEDYEKTLVSAGAGEERSGDGQASESYR